MTDRAALLANILENPGDDLPRLIFADWMEEHGEGDRAEFIRVQIEIVRLEAVVKRWVRTPSNKKGGTAKDGGEAGAALAESQNLQDRAREILDAADGRWMSHILNRRAYSAALTWKYERGFISEITSMFRSDLQYLPAILAAHPIEKVICDGIGFEIEPGKNLVGEPKWGGWVDARGHGDSVEAWNSREQMAADAQRWIESHLNRRDAAARRLEENRRVYEEHRRRREEERRAATLARREMRRAHAAASGNL